MQPILESPIMTHADIEQEREEKRKKEQVSAIILSAMMFALFFCDAMYFTNYSSLPPLWRHLLGILCLIFTIIAFMGMGMSWSDSRNEGLPEDAPITDKSTLLNLLKRLEPYPDLAQRFMDTLEIRDYLLRRECVAFEAAIAEHEDQGRMQAVEQALREKQQSFREAAIH